ncbi:hypothetical protein LRAMOSA04689 [Lichtheimia ramosa]|uniref:Yeast cell wall synthesis Kre9/Knh1-like N-terminal domain-containing protein n=1 Tax=Lichtheimia ramosa TaxID=688394 RepID=A0A077WZ21_9FUNG|nr:hypothetical protein LRAMOSA04689 [Lichtheimia ramosa]
MKSFVSTLVFALGTAALAAAQSSAGAFYITAPLEGDTWTAGKTETIKWINGMNQNISINLIEGKDSNSMVSTGDSINANGISGTASWNVPADIDTSGRYALRFDYTDSNGNDASSYSGAIKIVKGSSSSSSAAATKSSSISGSVSGSSSAIMTASQSYMPHASSSASISGASSSTQSSSSAKGTTPSTPPNLKPSLAASTTPEAITEGSAINLKVAAFSIAIPAVLACTLF